MGEDINGCLEGERMDEWQTDLLISGRVGGQGHSVEATEL